MMTVVNALLAKSKQHQPKISLFLTGGEVTAVSDDADSSDGDAGTGGTLIAGSVYLPNPDASPRWHDRLDRDHQRVSDQQASRPRRGCTPRQARLRTAAATSLKWAFTPLQISRFDHPEVLRPLKLPPHFGHAIFSKLSH